MSQSDSPNEVRSSDGLGLLPEAEWLAGENQAWRADIVRVWPAENAARYTVPLFTADQLHAAVAAERERCAKLVEKLRPCLRGDCDDLAAAIRGA